MEPVILLTFANDRDDYLPNITRERKSIFSSLQDSHDNHAIKVHKEESTGIEDIFNSCIRYGKDLVIFHYGGHADGSLLKLEGTPGHYEPAYAKGLSELLGQRKNLKLVFLNGCATKGQVELFFAAGVPAVIATSAKIKDKDATEFAEQFYNALASQRSIKEAFSTANAFIKTRYYKKRDIEIRIVQVGDRAVNWKGKDDDTADSREMPWGLYVNENHDNIKEVLNWKLPTSPPPALFMPESGDYGSDADPNSELMDMLFREALKYNTELSDKINESKKKDSPLGMRKIKPMIFYSFPMPVCEHLRILNNKKKIGIDRLRQIVNTYNACAELLCFATLSQLWDDLHYKRLSYIDEEHLTVLNSFFGLTRENISTYNYLKLARTVLMIFQDNPIEPFFHDFKDLWQRFTDGDEFYQAHRFFEEMKRNLAGEQVGAHEIEALCIQAVNALGVILLAMSPLMKYKITSIKRVEVERLRHQPAKFKHNWVVLDVRETEDEFMAFRGKFTDYNSVIISKHEKSIDEYLSLSPLIIDKNALQRQPLSKLFFYGFQDIQTNEYNFRFSQNIKDMLHVTDDKEFGIIKDQLDRFKETILAVNERQ